MKINIPPKPDPTAAQAAAGAQTPPTAAQAATTPPQTVTVSPQPTDPAAATGAQTGGATPVATTGRHHRHHKNAIANSDPNATSPTQSGPVTTGVEPATCDADGDGVADAGAPSNCTSPPPPAPTDTGASGSIQDGAIKPLAYSAPKKHRPAPTKKKIRR